MIIGNWFNLSSELITGIEPCRYESLDAACDHVTSTLGGRLISRSMVDSWAYFSVDRDVPIEVKRKAGKGKTVKVIEQRRKTVRLLLGHVQT